MITGTFFSIDGQIDDNMTGNGGDINSPRPGQKRRLSTGESSNSNGNATCHEDTEQPLVNNATTNGESPVAANQDHA